MPVVVSFYTDDFYKREAFELVRTCQAFGLDYDVRQVSHQGSWAANTNVKPFFLRDMAACYPARNLLWLDADARVRQLPVLFDGLPLPVAFHRWLGKHPASGTVFLGPGCGALLTAWIEEVQLHPARTDQVCLGDAVAATGTHEGALPESYCYIYDFHSDEPDPDAIVVIEHMQASRWTKKKGRL